MKSIKINGSQRESLGKSSTKALRNAGKVPCVVYGGEKPVHFSADEISFSKLVYTPNAHTVVISLDDKSEMNAVIQDIQFHPVSEKILHIDFLEVFDDKPVIVSIPVKLQGIPLGVRNGGNLMFRRNKIITKGLVSKLPDAIELNVESLAIGMFIYIKDINIDGCQFLAPENSVVVGVKTARNVIEEASSDDESEESEDSNDMDEVAKDNNETKEESSGDSEKSSE